MAFDRSQLKVLDYRPFRWQTAPTLSQPGVKGAELDGVFILLSPEIVTWMKQNLTQAQKDEIDGWVYRVSSETPLPANHVSASLWNVPLWSGETRSIYLRVPAATWNDPATPPPDKVKTYFRTLWQEAA